MSENKICTFWNKSPCVIEKRLIVFQWNAAFAVRSSTVTNISCISVTWWNASNIISSLNILALVSCAVRNTLMLLKTNPPHLITLFLGPRPTCPAGFMDPADRLNWSENRLSAFFFFFNGTRRTCQYVGLKNQVSVFNYCRVFASSYLHTGTESRDREEDAQKHLHHLHPSLIQSDQHKHGVRSVQLFSSTTTSETVENISNCNVSDQKLQKQFKLWLSSNFSCRSVLYYILYYKISTRLKRL